MIPKDFDGSFKIPITNTFKFYEKVNSDVKDPFIIHFYRRENEIKSIGEFIDSITPENIGWDKPTKQLFYKDKNGKTYQLKFEELK
jgi:hypothetical protein